MERVVGFVKNGGLRLPPGFRFHPTDEELVVQYLKRKVLSYPLPASIIPELVDVCKSDPWDLPGTGTGTGDREQERYFFSTRDPKGNRATGSGYWKATGLDKQIVSSRNNNGEILVVGMKKTLVFYRGKPPKGLITDWIMHEYRLVTKNINYSTQTQAQAQVEENWVLCRIYLKKRRRRRRRRNNTTNNNNKISTTTGHVPTQLRAPAPVVVFNYNFLEDHLNNSSSSGSSDVTQVQVSNHINQESDDHEQEYTSCAKYFF